MAQNDLKPNHSSSEEDEEEEEASGSDDEQETASESEESSDSATDDKPQPEPKKTLIPPPKSAIKPPAPDASSESEELGSETDSDSPPKKPAAANPNIKPIRSIPMERERERSNPESELAKKAGSKSGTKAVSAPSPASKRPAAVSSPANEKDPKKAKSNTATDDETKKQLFQRLWSEDDEIVILKGMIDYKAESGENLIADNGAFHEFIKKSLHVDVSRAQLVDKIRRLRKKYVNNVSREEKNGKDRNFSKSHEQKAYELSKLIWGNGGYNSGTTESKKNNKSQKNGNAAAGTSAGGVKSNGLDDKVVLGVEIEKSLDISRFVRFGGKNDSPVLPEEIVKAGMELAEGEKRVELEEKWRSLKKQELELYLKKMDLVKEQALIVLEAVNLSGN